jgi:serine protease Do
VLVRVTDMRGINLNVFTFDYDLAWAGLFLDADQRVLGRFGGRTPDSAERYHSLAGLRYAMKQALIEYSRRPQKPRCPERPQRTVDQYSAIKRYGKATCIHCHQAYDFPREQEVAAGIWEQESLWVYPIPENLGFRVAAEQGNRVEAVSQASPAASAGLRAGDVLEKLNGLPVASFADVQYALHKGPVGVAPPNQSSIPVKWSRAGELHEARLLLPAGWRQTDLSWRASTRAVGPNPCVQGEDLSVEEKRRLGLGARQLAFRQGSFPVPAVRQAGIKPNDIIIGIDGKRLEMNARQFGAYIRLNYHVGDRVTINLLRNGQITNASLILPASLKY